MVVQIEGKLVSLEGAACWVQTGAVCYELMLPGYAVSQLAGQIGATVTLCTMEYYEGTLGGGNLVPRMVGFLSKSERDFFDIYTSVKGMGIKKGLKSLAMPVERIAAAIESGDEKLLATLPGVGKKMAQMIVAELAGKLTGYAAQTDTQGKPRAAFATYQTEALEILIAWGEKRAEAMELIELTCRRHPEVKTAEQLVPLAYRVKQGIEV
jgi:Holliday junction DNA helicase RuvA